MSEFDELATRNYRFVNSLNSLCFISEMEGFRIATGATIRYVLLAKWTIANWGTQRTLKLLGIALFVRFQRGLQLGVARDDKVLRAHAEGGESGVGE